MVGENSWRQLFWEANFFQANFFRSLGSQQLPPRAIPQESSLPSLRLQPVAQIHRFRVSPINGNAACLGISHVLQQSKSPFFRGSNRTWKKWTLTYRVHSKTCLVVSPVCEQVLFSRPRWVLLPVNLLPCSAPRGRWAREHALPPCPPNGTTGTWKNSESVRLRFHDLDLLNIPHSILRAHSFHQRVGQNTAAVISWDHCDSISETRTFCFQKRTFEEFIFKTN